VEGFNENLDTWLGGGLVACIRWRVDVDGHSLSINDGNVCVWGVGGSVY
jgi:hypothetical protein